MENFFAIILIIGIIQVFLALIMKFKSSVKNFILGSGFTMITIAFIAAIIYYSKNIPAIDVYRGKTTLQITYEDNIPIDSVVVYKNK